MRKASTLKWALGLLLTPLLLFVILAALLYVPPVQNWAVQKAASIASEQTGKQISVGSVRLKWPLDLQLNDFLMTNEWNDTVAYVQQLVADVQLRPLFSKQVVVNQLELRQAVLDTYDLISDVQVSGEIGRLRLSSRGIDLGAGTAEVNGARLEDARLDIQLSDTAAVDTTESETLWRVNADEIGIYRTQVNVRMPGDTVQVGAYLGEATVSDVRADLARGEYTVGSIKLDGGAAEYVPLNTGPLRDITLRVDSVYYGPEGLRMAVRQAAMKEESSGLEVTELRGAVSMNADLSNVKLPGLTLKTPDSDIYAEADVDLNVADSLNPGKMHARLNAQIGKQDLQKLSSIAELPPTLDWRNWPNHPLQIRGSVNGNVQRMELTGVDVTLPTALHAKVDGVVHNLTDTDRMKADLNVQAEASDVSFLTAMAADALPADVRIPKGISLSGKVKANGPSYDFDVSAREGGGTVSARGSYNGTTEQYDADMKVNNLNVRHFLPRDSIGLLSAQAKVKGQGFDLMSTRSRLTANATVSQLQYGQWDLSGMAMHATLTNGRANACLESHNQLLSGTLSMDAALQTKKIDATLEPDIQRIDLQRLRLSANPLAVSMSGTVELHSDLRQSHEVRGRLGNLTLKDEKHSYQPADIGLYLKTTPDTTWVRAQSGDFIVKLDARGGYERLISQATTLADSIVAQLKHKVIDQPQLKQLLPTMRLYVESGRENPLISLLKTYDIELRQLHADLTSSPEEGLNGDLDVTKLIVDSILLDTVRLHLRHRGERLTYQAQVTNNRKNPQFVFNTLVDGHLTEHGALAGLRYYDQQGRMGMRIGAQASMEDNGIRIRLMPEKPTVGYKVFTLNDDNYLFIDKQGRLQAKVDLIADDKAGVKLYTEDQDPTMLQDLTVSLNRIDLGELTSVLPYVPHVKGILNGDYHIVMDENERISVASDMEVSGMEYEGSPIGNINAELVYMQREEGTHALEATLYKDGSEVGQLRGDLTPGSQHGQASAIDATLQMTRLPLNLVNGFVPDQLIGLDGYGEGELTIKGTTARPVVDGEVYVDSAYLVSVPYGVRMRFDNDPVRIVGSHLLLENFGLYAYNEEPLNLQGDLDFSDLDHMSMDLRMRARNLLLIDAKQTPKSLAFGKAFVNFYARMNGPMEALKMRGRLDVLGSTDMTYMLLDSPLSTDNRLEELVKFTDFNDTTQVVTAKRPTPSGLDMDLTLSVSQGAHIVCNLNTDQTNYVDLMGGGDLRMRYGGTDGLTLTGRYTLSNGEMKYSIPVIPLKTFTIQNGSYVEFTGDPMNPRLNITATERTKAAVGGDGEQSRSVAFDCGVVITKTLNDMGLQFIISAPEDMTVNTELQSMSAEERGKLAVTMLTTGMYLADGNTSGFSMNSVLSAYLQSEINNITGSALKTIDLQVGLDNTTDAAGQSHTDYSFKFSKRLFDNRLKIQLGGKVSSGADEMNGQRQSFFDNVTMEYRLDQSAQKNLKLFYQQNVYDWLDGYTGLYGVGYVWRKKMDSLWDVFSMFSKERPFSPMTTRPDSVRTDTLKTLRP